MEKQTDRVREAAHWPADPSEVSFSTVEQMVGPQLHVTPNLRSLALTLSPPTRRPINLIASACSGTLAADKWVSSATHAPVRRVHVCVRAR